MQQQQHHTAAETIIASVQSYLISTIISAGRMPLWAIFRLTCLWSVIMMSIVSSTVTTTASPLGSAETNSDDASRTVSASVSAGYASSTIPPVHPSGSDLTPLTAVRKASCPKRSPQLLRVIIDSLIASGAYDSWMVSPHADPDFAVADVYHGSRFSVGYRASTFISAGVDTMSAGHLPSPEEVAFRFAQCASVNANRELIYNRTLQEIDAAIARRLYALAHPELPREYAVHADAIRSMLVDAVTKARKAVLGELR